MKYTYRAKKGPNEIVTGTVEAHDQHEVTSRLTAAGEVPLEIKVLEESAEEKSVLSGVLERISSRLHQTALKRHELVVFTRQLSDMVSAGVPLLTALTLSAEHMSRPESRDILDRIMVSVKDGGTLSDAFARNGRSFPPLYANMVRAGEISGDLAGVLQRLADFAERDEEDRRQIQAALAYPLMTLVLGMISVWVMLTFVVPRLKVLFDDLGTELPLITRVLLGVSAFFHQIWWVILLGLAVLGIYFYSLSRDDLFRRWTALLKRVPWLGRLQADAAMARFFRALGTLIQGGADLVAAIQTAAAVTGDPGLDQSLCAAADEVAGGQSLASALKGHTDMAQSEISMLVVAEETGSLADGCSTVAHYHERRVQQAVRLLHSILEPALILVIGLVIGGVIMAVLLPVFQMNVMMP
ncbi:MAG: type II secretion system F family protein [Candidatus Omnitrophota bacterium]